MSNEKLHHNIIKVSWWLISQYKYCFCQFTGSLKNLFSVYFNVYSFFLDFQDHKNFESLVSNNHYLKIANNNLIFILGILEINVFIICYNKFFRPHEILFLFFKCNVFTIITVISFCVNHMLYSAYALFAIFTYIGIFAKSA